MTGPIRTGAGVLGHVFPGVQRVKEPEMKGPPDLAGRHAGAFRQATVGGPSAGPTTVHGPSPLAAHGLNPQKLRALCLALAGCESENEVMATLRERGLWDRSGDWLPLGGIQNNFSTVGNQQSSPLGALGEKLTNAVDAVLMAECLARGIDPRGDKAPQSMQEALSQLFGIRDGDLAATTPAKRQKLAEKIRLVASGSKMDPCYSIIDLGEGQTPLAMPDTLLSIVGSNKLKIPFVQGKFNMGGTGALLFCGGDHNLQLIISKRDPRIVSASSDSDVDSCWSFTVIRRFPPGPGEKSSSYRYLAPKGQVLFFPADSLPLLPDRQEMTSGTCIKLFNYKLTSALRGGNATDELYKALASLLPGTSLPFTVIERRNAFRSAEARERIFSGLEPMIHEAGGRKILEPDFPDATTLTVGGETLKVSIRAFKRGALAGHIGGEGIIFTVNGQRHAEIPRNFFDRKEVGMGLLSDSLLVEIDCSGLSERVREDLFMNSRDRLRNGSLKTAIETELESLLSRHRGLKALRDRRRSEDIREQLEKSPFRQSLTALIERSPLLFDLLSQKGRGKVELRDHPTYFRLRTSRPYTSKEPKRQSMGRPIVARFLTNADNKYFVRGSDQGLFTVTINGSEIKKFGLELWNGEATLTVPLPRAAKVGDILKVECAVADPTRTEPFYNCFFAKVESPSTTERGPGQPHDSGETRQPPHPSRLKLPEVVEVGKSDWPRHGFDNQSAVRVVMDDNGVTVFANMENHHFLKALKDTNDLSPTDFKKERYKCGLSLIIMALLRKHQWDTAFSEEDEERDNETNVYDTIRETVDALAPMILPMMSLANPGSATSGS